MLPKLGLLPRLGELIFLVYVQHGWMVRLANLVTNVRFLSFGYVKVVTFCDPKI